MSTVDMNKPSPRNVPQQSRSQQRVDLILNTAADLFAEVGYETATTTAIAERAGISIGSLYRYFSDKSTILDALAARYCKEQGELFERVFTSDVVYLPLAVLLDRLVDPFLEMHSACPVYTHILLGTDGSADINIAFASQEIEQEAVKRLTGIFQQWAPYLDREQVLVTAMLCRATTKALISLRSSDPHAEQDEDFKAYLTAECKRMLLTYLEKTLGEDRSSKRRKL